MKTQKNDDLTCWDRNYAVGRYNEYPYDAIVSQVAGYYYGVKDKKKIRILDLGFGGGNHISFLAEKGFDAYGVDSSAVAEKIVEKQLKRKGLKADLTVCDFEDLPYKNGYFDCIIDRASLQHNVKSSILGIVDEVYRVLKKRGLYIGILAGMDHPGRGSGRKLKGENTYRDFSGGPYAKSGVTHFFDRKELVQIFHKFKIETMHRRVVLDETGRDGCALSSEYLLVGKKKG